MAHETIIIEETGPDWEPTALTAFYAQRGKLYAFGRDEQEALSKLLEAEYRLNETSRREQNISTGLL